MKISAWRHKGFQISNRAKKRSISHSPKGLHHVFPRTFTMFLGFANSFERPLWPFCIAQKRLQGCCVSLTCCSPLPHAGLTAKPGACLSFLVLLPLSHATWCVCVKTNETTYPRYACVQGAPAWEKCLWVLELKSTRPLALHTEKQARDVKQVVEGVDGTADFDGLRAVPPQNKARPKGPTLQNVGAVFFHPQRVLARHLTGPPAPEGEASGSCLLRPPRRCPPTSHMHPPPLPPHHTASTHALPRTAAFASRNSPVARCDHGPPPFFPFNSPSNSRLLPPQKGALATREGERRGQSCGGLAGWVDEEASRAQRRQGWTGSSHRSRRREAGSRGRGASGSKTRGKLDAAKDEERDTMAVFGQCQGRHY